MSEPPSKTKAKTKARTKAAPRAPRRDAGRPRGQVVEDAVLARTLEEIAAHGIADLSVERIAAAAELNKTSVYRRWPTRGALIAAALQRVAEDLGERLGDQGSLAADLLALARTVAAFLEGPLGAALARAALSEATAPEIAEMARTQLAQRALGPAAQLVQRAQARGEWRADVPPEPVLTMLVGSLLHRLLLERQPPDDHWLTTVIRVLVAGVRPDGPTD